MFLTSALVPYSFCPTGLMDTFASHLKDPCSMFPSHTPRYLRIALSFFMYSAASFGVLISGSETISMSGMPALLRSTKL